MRRCAGWPPSTPARPGSARWNAASPRCCERSAPGAAVAPPPRPVSVAPQALTGYLGQPRHTPEAADRTAVPGVATGLAVTGTGGEVLFVEASLADPEAGTTGATPT